MKAITKLQKIKKLIMLSKLLKLKQLNKRKRRVWCREWLLRRDSLHLGACSFVQNELLQEDFRSYQNFLRMDFELFEKLHTLIESDIKKMDTQFRCSIPSRFRLIITLRYLATGETFTSLSYASRVAVCTISKFVPEVLRSIYNNLQRKYLKMPSTPEEWKIISNKFYEDWNVPNTIGAMDGKHIVFRAPRSAGSHYYNYKGTHSIVLLAIVDANYNFIYVDIGTNGRVSDGGVYEDCDFAYELNRNNLNLPEDVPLPGLKTPVPYVLLADAAFPLQEHILKPYPFKNMTHDERIYNYRVSRARRVVENAFGIMANRFRILLTPITLSRDKVVLITQACCVLHNFIKMESPKLVSQEVDVEEETGKVLGGTWRSSTNKNTLQSVAYRRRRPNNKNLVIREEFKFYFNNNGKVSRQEHCI